MEGEKSDQQAIDEFFKFDRNYIIMTNSGIPVFCYQGDMYQLSTLYATLYAVISKMQNYQFQRIDLQEDEELKLEGKKKSKSKQPEPYFGEKESAIIEAEETKGKGFFDKLRKKKEAEVRLFGKDQVDTYVETEEGEAAEEEEKTVEEE